MRSCVFKTIEVLIVTCGLFCQVGYGSDILVQKKTPLGLFRVDVAGASLSSDKFNIDQLSPSQYEGAARRKQGEAEFLTLKSGKVWARPLRGRANEITFVSFQICASEMTILDIAGARLAVVASPVSGSAQLMYDSPVNGGLQWTPLNFHVSTAKFSGNKLAALPTLTIRIDPANGTWDIFVGARLLADNLHLVGTPERQIKFYAGVEGLWVSGLVFADENPIYEDRNRNGIDDLFEQQRLGGLLSENAPPDDRRLMAQQWKADQRIHPPKPFPSAHPRSDDVISVNSVER